MIERIEADEHVRYVDVEIANGRFITGRMLITYHTYDELSKGDEVRICGGVLEGEVGEVVFTDVVPPSIHDNPIYTYRCERSEPRVVAVETVRTWSDGSTTHETVWSES